MSEGTPAPPTARPGRWSRLRAFVAPRYLAIDPRTAGLFRLALGALLFLDGLRHAGEARLLYANEGVLTNHHHLYKPSSGHQWSLFHAFSSLDEVRVLFGLGLLAHLLLFVGYRTRWAAIASFVFVTSMDQRIPLVENGGYVVVNLLAFYACFLPVGRRFSVDAWLASWRARKETTVAELSDRTDTTGERAPVVTIAYLLAVLNLAIVYFFNVVNKSGSLWRRGETVHYVLHLDRMITGVTVHLRDVLPYPVLVASGWLVLCVEAVIFACIVWPHARRITRPLAAALMLGLHGTFGVMMRLGPFSWFMIGWSTLLSLPVHFERALDWWSARSRGVVLGLDPTSAWAMTLGRVVKRLDGRARVRFVERSGGAPVAVRDHAAEAPWNEAPRRVVARVAEALPFGRPALAVLDVLSLGLARRALQAALASPARMERWFGLDLAERPGRGLPNGARERAGRATGLVRETFLVVMGLCFASQAWNENKALPKQVKYEQPEIVRALIGYPRLFQGWGMFAPNPIQEDGVLVVDGFTIDGRHVDPYNGGAPDLDLSDARGAGQSQLRQDYGNRIRLDRNAPYRQGLEEYLRRWHLETGRPEDELVGFDVYWVRDKCPPPGSDRPLQNDPVPIATWRKPGVRKLADGRPVPPPPRLRSAESWPGDPPKKKD